MVLENGSLTQLNLLVHFALMRGFSFCVGSELIPETFAYPIEVFYWNNYNSITVTPPLGWKAELEIYCLLFWILDWSFSKVVGIHQNTQEFRDNWRVSGQNVTVVVVSDVSLGCSRSIVSALNCFGPCVVHSWHTGQTDQFTVIACPFPRLVW